MPRTTTKSKAKSKKAVAKNCESHGIRPSVGIIITLSVALLIAIVISVFSIAALKNTNSNLNVAKLDVFDHLVEETLNNTEITSDAPSVQKATGYGISDEDGVLYVTFDYTTYDVSNPDQPIPSEPKHGVMYFWKNAENGTYSHAFSYHDEAYHPAGTYVEISE